MIQQPELGKKIAELRKERGLTQEQLVEKCKLNVRTLQRIESGEVMPRTYTISLISEALEYPLVDSDSGYEPTATTIDDSRQENNKTFVGLTRRTKKGGVILLGILSIFVISVVLKNNQQSLLASKPFQSALNEASVESNSELNFLDYSCLGCTESKGLLIGRDMSFKLNGVQVSNVRLMVIDKETRAFDALFVKGQFLQQKVIINYPKDYLIDGSMAYSADSVQQSAFRIILKGKAKVYDQNNKSNPDDDESIEAEEIVIQLN